MANIKIYDEEDDNVEDDNIFDSDNLVDNTDYSSTKSEDDEDDEKVETFSDSEYKVSSFSNSFLNIECNTKIESSKTTIKFRYQGETYKGIVMQKLPYGSDDYIFYVQKYGKIAKGEKNKKFMKKIHIPDATML